MEQACYEIKLHQREWVVSVGGAPVLICKHKKTATRTVSVATHLLLVNQPLSPGRFSDTSTLLSDQQLANEPNFITH